MSLIKTWLHNQMSDSVELNPIYYWKVYQQNPKTGETWEDYCFSEDETLEMIEQAKKDGHLYKSEKFREMEID